MSEFKQIEPLGHDAAWDGWMSNSAKSLRNELRQISKRIERISNRPQVRRWELVLCSVKGSLTHAMGLLQEIEAKVERERQERKG